MTLNPPKTDWWKMLDAANSMFDRYDLFRSFIEVGACALAHPNREEEYLKALAPYKADPNIPTLFANAFGALMFERIKDPYTDTLGPTYMAIKSQVGKQDSGAFYTPQSVSRLMAELTFDYATMNNSTEPMMVMEPAGGSGGMLLAAAELMARHGHQDRLVVELWDLDFTATQMALINLSLARVKGKVVHGNTLSQEVMSEWYTNTKLVDFFQAQLPPELLEMLGGAA